tara:strand:- start:20 stop:451 length:432 start_codon:yes stop_codon:yes gene_type:complete
MERLKSLFKKKPKPDPMKTAGDYVLSRTPTKLKDKRPERIKLEPHERTPLPKHLRRMSAEDVNEAEYQGRKVTLNKPMAGDVKKSKVFVKDPQSGNVKKVNFGDPNMKIKKSNPARRKSFRARHNCDNPGPKTKARYWSCKAW